MFNLWPGDWSNLRSREYKFKPLLGDGGLEHASPAHQPNALVTRLLD